MNEINENNSKKNIHNDPDLYLKLFEDNDIKEELIDNEIENNKIMKENILDQIKNYINILNEIKENNDKKSNEKIKQINFNYLPDLRSFLKKKQKNFVIF